MRKQNVLNEKKSPRVLALLGGNNSCSSNSKNKGNDSMVLAKAPREVSRINCLSKIQFCKTVARYRLKLFLGLHYSHND